MILLFIKTEKTAHAPAQLKCDTAQIKARAQVAHGAFHAGPRQLQQERVGQIGWRLQAGGQVACQRGRGQVTGQGQPGHHAQQATAVDDEAGRAEFARHLLYVLSTPLASDDI